MPDPHEFRSPLQNAFLLGALTFSIFEIIEIFIKILYYLGIRFANFELVAAKEKLEIVKSHGEGAPNSGGLSRRNAFGLIQEYCTIHNLVGKFPRALARGYEKRKKKRCQSKTVPDTVFNQ